MRRFNEVREATSEHKRQRRQPPVVYYVIGVIILVFAVIRIYQLFAGRL